MAEAALATAAIIGAGATTYSALKKTKTPDITQADPINTDDATAQADDLLRKRQRKGINANLLSGSVGDSAISASSSGQKTLLGG